MNRVCLIGRLTSKPELRYTTSNIACTNITVAIDRNYGEEKKTDFINVVVWRKQAENVCKYLDKGSLVSIEGRLQTNNYEDKDGNKRYSMEVVADSVQFLESKGQRSNRTNDVSPYDYQQPSNNQTGNYTNDVNVEDDPFADFGDSVSISDDFLD